MDFLSRIVALFRRASPASVPGIPDPEIPRYPPFTEGFPLTDADRLLASQQDLVDRLRTPLDQDEPMFDRLTMPVLRNFCSTVHLLPASASHHHAGPGGLLRHSLEVAFYTVRMTETVWLVGDQPPEDRRALVPVWKFAFFLAGLCHDVGKPLSDMAVTSRDGSAEWNPLQSSLLDWAVEHRIDRYFLHWRPGRHKRHEQFSVVAAPRVFGDDALSYLAEGGPELLQAVLTAVSGVDDGKIYTMMTRADQASVERDLKNTQIATGGPYGVPVDKFLVDAMRRLLEDGTWKVNQPGARVWVLADGVYIVWGKASEEIGKLLSRDKTPGVPRGKHSLADVLLERGLAVPMETDRGPGRYWEITPAPLANTASATPPTPLSALRLSDPHILFEGQVPPPVEPWSPCTPSATDDEKPLPSPGDDTVEATTRNNADDAAAATPPNNATAERAASDDTPAPSDDTRSAPPSADAGATAPSAATSSRSAAAVPDDSAPSQRAPTQTAATATPRPVERTQNAARHGNANTSSAPTTHTRSATADTSPREQDIARWFITQGLAGEFLLRVAAAVRDGKFVDGTDYNTEPPVLLTWPETAKRLKMTTSDTLAALRAKGVVQPNPNNPIAPLFTRGALRGITLSADAEPYFLAACRADPGLARVASDVEAFRDALLRGDVSDDTKREGGEVCVKHGAVKVYAVNRGFGAAKDFAVFMQSVKADARFRVLDKKLVCVADPRATDTVGGPFS